MHLFNHRYAIHELDSSYTVLVWAIPFSLATTQRITFWSLFSQVLRGFTSLHTLLYSYEFTVWYLGLNLDGLLHIGNPRIKACLTAPRGISQPTTSFIGLLRQGIHRMPLICFIEITILFSFKCATLDIAETVIY